MPAGTDAQDDGDSWAEAGWGDDVACGYGCFWLYCCCCDAAAPAAGGIAGGVDWARQGEEGHGLSCRIRIASCGGERVCYCCLVGWWEEWSF